MVYVSGKIGQSRLCKHKKSSAWSRVAGVQFPSGTTVRNFSTKIKTEADLVKKREGLNHCQSESQASASAHIRIVTEERAGSDGLTPIDV